MSTRGTFKQLYVEFRVPALLAIAWTTYILKTTELDITTGRVLSILGPSFFFFSWGAAQWFRVRKQQRTTEGIDSIDTKVANVLQDLDRYTKKTVESIRSESQRMVASMTGGDSFLYVALRGITDTTAGVQLSVNGDNTMFNVRFAIKDVESIRAASERLQVDASDANLNQFFALGIKRTLPELDPLLVLLIGTMTIPTGTTKRLVIDTEARNGRTRQLILVVDVPGTGWEWATRVTPDHSASTILFHYATDNFPHDHKSPEIWHWDFVPPAA